MWMMTWQALSVRPYPAGVQLSGMLNIANFQEGDLQVRDLFAEAVIACTEGEDGKQLFKSFTFEISAGEITYKGHTVAASLVGEVYVYYEEDATGGVKEDRTQKTAVKGTLDVEWNNEPDVFDGALGAGHLTPGPMIRHPGTVRMLKHGEIADLGATSAYLKLIFDSRTNAIIGRVGFEHYIQDVGTVRGEGQMVNHAACDDDPSLTSYIRGELEVIPTPVPPASPHLP
jgi:hypothetical protein